MKSRTASSAIAAVAAGIAAAAAVTAQAHHSAAPHYDLAREITIKGVVTKFEFVNPHAYVYFLAADVAGAQQTWRCELAARATLSRMGWTQGAFEPGQKLVFKGAPARREENVCVLNSFVREDGVAVSAHADLLSADLQRGVMPPTAPLATVTVAPGTAGHASLDGYWVSREQGPPGRGGPPGAGGRGNGPPAGGDSGLPQPTAAGTAAASGYDQRFDDPALRCSPGNILFGWTHDQNVNEIVSRPDEITLKYGYMDFQRVIRLDQREHPRTLTPSLAGHSIGHWEGNVLVVDTVGFQPGVLNAMSGLQHSAQLHVIERFSLDAAGNTLTREYSAEDPLYLLSPWRGSDTVLRSREAPVRYACKELSGKNNQRPGTGTRGGANF